MTPPQKFPHADRARSGDASEPALAEKRRHIRSAELFNGEREVLIEHAGELYSLRHTSKGKLILTK